LSIELETPIVFKKGDTAVIHYLDGGKLRIVGILHLE